MRNKISFLAPCLLLFLLLEEAKSWQPPLEIDVVSIKFDFESGYADDALDICKNASTDIATPEWLPPSRNNPLAYIKSQTNRHIVVTFTHNQSVGDVCTMVVKANAGGYYPGTVQETDVQFPSCGTTASAELTLSGGSTPSYVQKWGFSLYWYVTEVNEQVQNPNLSLGTTGNHLYYTLLAAPQNPMSEPWTDVLDYACVWARYQTSETNALTKITEGAFDDFDVDYYGGSSHSYLPNCNLTGLLNSSWADCQDMSAIVHIFTKAIGGSNTKVKKINGSFRTESIDPIGSPGWGATTWNFHQVGWKSNVWDACLRLDQSNPRIPVNESINGAYKNDLFDYGYWNPQTPQSYTNVY